MQPKEVQQFYNTTAKVYAKKLFRELNDKSLDRLLLERFAKQYQLANLVGDLGCGPGQTSRFLYGKGLKNILGVDLSEGMIQEAKTLSPNINFQVGNMLDLPFENNHFDGLVAFYAIVHFKLDQLEVAFQEMFRTLKSNGQLLFSFHVGTQINSIDDFMGIKAKASFYFFEVETVLAILERVGFEQVEVVLRHPYPEAEYPSQRAYVTMKKP